MPIDLDAIAPEARRRYIEVGRRYGSQLTLAQADDVIAALSTHRADLVPRGFGARDEQRLIDARDLQLTLGVERGAARAEVTAASQAFTAAMQRGKQARLDADAVLRAARADLVDAGASEVVTAIDIALASSASAGADGDALRGQLARLREALSLPRVAETVADRGGPEAVAAIDAAVTALRAAEAARPGKPGTPEQTERLDLLDGIIIDLVRRARRAARAAAQALGRPALAAAFELDALYQRPRRPPAPEPTEG